jgi:hypothetical protein
VLYAVPGYNVLKVIAFGVTKVKHVGSTNAFKVSVLVNDVGQLLLKIIDCVYSPLAVPPGTFSPKNMVLLVIVFTVFGEEIQRAVFAVVVVSTVPVNVVRPEVILHSVLLTNMLLLRYTQLPLLAAAFAFIHSHDPMFPPLSKS